MLPDYDYSFCCIGIFVTKMKEHEAKKRKKNPAIERVAPDSSSLDPVVEEIVFPADPCSSEEENEEIDEEERDDWSHDKSTLSQGFHDISGRFRDEAEHNESPPEQPIHTPSQLMRESESPRPEVKRSV